MFLQLFAPAFQNPAARMFVKQCRTINRFSISAGVRCPSVLLSVSVPMGMMKASETVLRLTFSLRINYLLSLNSPRLVLDAPIKGVFLRPAAV